MGTKTATIRDVAERAGVAKSTASRVLSGAATSIPISAETRQLVLGAARDLGYRPHRGARSLSGKNSHLLGVIVRETDDPWFADLIDAISHVALERGYDVVLGNARRSPDEAMALRDTMLDLRYCDGLLLCGDLQESAEDHTFLRHMARDRRSVAVSRGVRELSHDIPYVGVDNAQGTCLAMEYLARLGHRRIACISSDRVGDLADRVESYSAFMSSLIGAVPEGYLVLGEHHPDAGYQAARRLWGLALPPTAVFATADSLAIGALAALLDMGIAVPADASVIGFDDLAFSRFVRPALTTIHEPVKEIGRAAVEVVVEMTEGRADGDASVPRRLLAPRFVERASCGPVPSGVSLGHVPARQVDSALDQTEPGWRN